MNERTSALDDVRRALLTERRLCGAFKELSLSIDEGGALTIEGEVESVAEKRIALKRAACVNGIAGIVDRLHVKPAEPMKDKAIRRHILRALAEDAAFANIDLSERETMAVVSDGKPPEGATGVVVESNEGVVVLNGALPSLEHKRLAGALAWWVPGVRDVVNGLAVEPQEEDSPDHIEEAVRIVLEKDPFIDAAQIKVGVKERVVRLTGAVATETERHMAESDAWCVFGVDDVIDEIEVVA